MASRSGLAPHVMAYWLTSAWIARQAASLIAAGAAKSGNPWARLIAPWRRARRVISRITDSVKRPALAETRVIRMRPLYLSKGRLTPAGVLTLRLLQEPGTQISCTRLEHFGVLSRELMSGGAATLAFSKRLTNPIHTLR